MTIIELAIKNIESASGNPIREFGQPLPSAQDIVTDPYGYARPGYLAAMTGFLAEHLRQNPDFISLASGTPHNALMEQYWNGSLMEATQRMINEIDPREGAQYNNPQGNQHLREWVSGHVSEMSGVEIKPQDIITFNGLQGAYAYMLDHLRYQNPHSPRVVLTQTPTYPLAVTPAEHEGVTVVSVETDDCGMTSNGLRRALEAFSEYPLMVYTMVVSNPSGRIMNDERGAELAQIAAEYEKYMYVDYAYKGVAYSDSQLEQPRIPYLRSPNVVLGLTGSKMVTVPGARVGMLISRSKELVAELKTAKALRDAQTPAQTELTYYELAKDGGYEAAVERTVPIYQEGRDAMMEAIEQNADVLRAPTPDAGIFVYGEVPEGLSTLDMLGRLIAEHNVAIIPGQWCQPPQVMKDGEVFGPPVKPNEFRLCFATQSPEKIKDAVNRFAAAVRNIASEQGVPLFE